MEIEGKKYLLEPNQAFCIPHFKGHRYYASEEERLGILSIHFKGRIPGISGGGIQNGDIYFSSCAGTDAFFI